MKEAMTDNPVLTCNHCEEDFKSSKYSSEYCGDCKSELNDPSNLESDLDLYVEDGELILDLTLTTTIPNRLQVNFGGEKIESGLIVAYIKLESGDGDLWFTDLWFKKDKGFQTINPETVAVTNYYSRKFGPEKEPNSNFQEKYRNQKGDLYDANEITATVEFECDELDDLEVTKNIAKFVAEEL